MPEERQSAPSILKLSTFSRDMGTEKYFCWLKKMTEQASPQMAMNGDFREARGSGEDWGALEAMHPFLRRTFPPPFRGMRAQYFQMVSFFQGSWTSGILCEISPFSNIKSKLLATLQTTQNMSVACDGPKTASPCPPLQTSQNNSVLVLHRQSSWIFS